MLISPLFIDIDGDNDTDMVTLNRDRTVFHLFENQGTATNPSFVFF